MDLIHCKKKGFVKETKMDTNRIEALGKIAKKKQQAADALPSTFANEKLTLLYDSLCILLECLAFQNHLKIYNHECYTAFLKEVLTKSRLGDEFEKFRRVRNAINYYGKELSLEEANEIISKMKRFIEQIKKVEK